MGESPEPFVPLKSTEKCFRYFGWGLLICSFVLFREIISHRMNQFMSGEKKRSKSRRKKQSQPLIISQPSLTTAATVPKMQMTGRASEMIEKNPRLARRRNAFLIIAKRTPEPGVNWELLRQMHAGETRRKSSQIKVQAVVEPSKPVRLSEDVSCKQESIWRVPMSKNEPVAHPSKALTSGSPRKVINPKVNETMQTRVMTHSLGESITSKTGRELTRKTQGKN